MSETLRVLLVEDSESDAALIIRELRHLNRPVSSKRVETADELRHALMREPWDVVLSDYTLPGFSAPSALGILKELAIDIPFIIISGAIGEDAAVAAMRAGAHDYVIKDKLARLCPAIERELREVANRTEQRTMQERLLISERMASVGILAAGVAHEINNPLVVVVANLDLAIRNVTGLANRLRIPNEVEDILAELGDAQEGAEKVRQVVRELGVFSRPDAEARGPVNIQRVIESSLRMAKNEIRHRARLITDFVQVPAVDGNAARLGQVFLNLIVNAAQAIPEGKASQNEIRVSTQLDELGRVVVSISDTGVGISPEHLSQIFDVFFTTKPVGVGTGLGLSICHRIVTSFGGEIRVESRVGIGTTFHVILMPAHIQVRTPVPPSVERALRRGNILLVDDEPKIAQVVEQMLSPEHTVELADHAADALERVRSGRRYDLILCDLMMPTMTGMDLHARLSEEVPAQAERMLFLTGGAFTPAAQAFSDKYRERIVPKPFSFDELRRVVNQHIK